MRLIILSIAAMSLFLGACSSEPPVTVKKGAEFTFDGQKLTVDYKASTVLVNEKDQHVLIAPEGKMYLLVDVKGQNSSYFASLKEGDKAVEVVDYLVSGPFLRDLDIETSPDKSDLYLVDAKGKYTIEIKSYSDEVASLSVTLKDEATVKINEKMRAFVKEFADGGRILEAAKKYVKSGVKPSDITTDQNGKSLFGDPITKGLKIESIKPDGTYVCSAEMWYESVEVTWDGDTISKILVVEKEY